MQHTVVVTQLNADEGSTPATHWYTTITAVYIAFTAVHNTYTTQKHLGYLNVKLLQP